MRVFVAQSAAWICLGIVVLIAVLPAGSILQLPSSAFDRALRYGVLSFLMVIAYPTKPLSTVSLVMVAALGLEILQLVLPWRLAAASHIVVKFLGSAIGIALGYLAVLLTWRFSGRN